MSLSKKFIVVIAMQIAVIAALVLYIKHRENDVKGEVIYNPIAQSTLNFSSPSADLQYFFEQQPNTTPQEFNPFWLQKEITYHINSDGLHERKDYPVDRDKNTYRIIALGDSFTFGMYVETDENWSNVLENRLNASIPCAQYKKTEVLNLGVSGYDIQYGYERYKKRGQKYNPDLVIWLVKDDDFEQLNEIMRKNEKIYIEEMKRTGEYQKFADAGKPYEYMKYVINDMEEYRDTVGTDQLLGIQDGYMSEFFNIYWGDVLFVTFSDTSPFYRDYLRLLESQRTNVSYLELPSLSSQKDLTFLPNDVHPTSKGHRAIARDIYTYLEKQLSCN